MVSSLSGLYTFKSVNRDFGLSMKKLKHERKKERNYVDHVVSIIYDS